MRISRNGIEIIKSFESFRAKLYICPAGKKTIGYGHVLRDSEDHKVITKSAAFVMLKKDIIIAERAVTRNIDLLLSQNQYDALVSFTFNVGGAAFQRSTLRQKINYESSNEEIYEEFIRWSYVRGCRIEGLIRRRKLEADLFFGYK